MIVITRKHSYATDDLTTLDLGTVLYDPKVKKMYILLAPGKLTEIGVEVLSVESAEALAEAITAGGNIKVSTDIDAPTGFVITEDTIIKNNAVISISEDTVGDGVFKATSGTLTLDGKGTINGLDKSGWSMAIWATGNGKVIINDGYFTNVGAYSETDGEHFDLIYASENGQVEINGGEFKCETPKWTLNIKDKDRATASIVVKGGKFHGFDPSNCEVEGPNTNFVAPGYKAVEEDGVYTVIAE